MNYSEFKQSAQTHLSEWIRNIHPNIEEGKFKSISGYHHILPLSNYTKGKRKDAIIEAIKKYDILTDNVKLNFTVLPKKELHTLANHLTSSQMLCYNFFRLFLPEEFCNSRDMKITPELKKWLHISFPDIPISESGKCEFEYKYNDEEGTSFDFCIHDDITTILFEIKYTENGFGKAPQDKRHISKFHDVYSKLLKKQNTIDKDIKLPEFLNNYQLFRNALRTSENVYAVVIYPENNTACSKEYENFLNSKLIKHPERLKHITWENAFSNSEVSKHSDLKCKYDL